MSDEKLCVDLYIRVSTDRQAKEGDSLEEQENELKKFCDYRGFRINKIYIERGKSGGNTNRPEYQKLVKDVENKKINAVIVKKIDRLSRSLLDFEALMTVMQTKDVEFISLRENFDTTTAMGKAMVRVALVFAQLEREQTSERLRDVFSFRASQGLYNGGTRPFGYTPVNKELVPYSKEKEIVELMFKSFLDFKSTSSVAKFLNDTGYRTKNGKLWDKRHLQAILQNQIYIGKVKWGDQFHQGIHQPIISDLQFQQTQAIFRNHSKRAGDSKTNALLQRLIICAECLCPMTPSHSLNRNKIKYFYYRCTSTQNAEKNIHTRCPIKSVAFDEAETWVIESLLSLSNETHFQPVENRLLKHNQTLDKDIQFIQESIRVLMTQLEQIKQKKDKYLDSLISGQFNKAERESISKRLEEMELELLKS